MPEVTLQVMIENLKRMYIKHDELIKEHTQIIKELKQIKEDIELLKIIIMHRSNKEARI